ncbi:MAG: metal ABC transporter permease, partial [Deltaproteobacteria bacterium]|nr:metal ABC transporter permease [Deltaproteobacteria bacterium]
LTARLITRHMLTFSLASAGLGAAAAFIGFYCAYRFDLPLGPTEVAVASLVLVAVAAAGVARRAVSRWQAA